LDTTQNHLELVEACKLGTRTAQFELYRLYSRAMYNTALRMVGQASDAEDLLQNAFSDVFMKMDTFRGESSIGAWIKRIVVNKCINFLKSRRLQFTEINASLAEPAEADYLDEAESAQNVERIHKAIGALPDGYRVVFSLYVLEGYDHEEISEILGVSEQTSKSQFSRAKAKLREILM
jgi:RNA polymerase sigma factor (sigma-70 family)